MSMVSMVVGAATADGATFVAKVDTGPVRVAVADNADMTSPTFTSSETVDAQGVAKVSIAGLDPDTRYWWQVEDNSTLDTSTTGRFRTHPTEGEPASFTIAAASCSGATPEFPGEAGGELDADVVSNSPVYDTIREARPLMFVNMGDWGYPDWSTNLTESVANRRTFYDDLLAQPRQGQFHREIPFTYGWDDHDFANNDSDGTYVDKANAATVYRERIPHYPLDDASGIWQEWVIGRVQFVLFDSRYYRDPNSDPQGVSKTMLGSAQKTWLENLLDTSTAEFLVVLSPSQWFSTTSDSWGSFTDERDEVAALFSTYGWSDRMVMVYGDRHGVGIDSGASNPSGSFPVMNAAPIDDSTVAASNPGRFDVLDDTPGTGQYGTVTVNDVGSHIAVTLTAWEDGNALGRYTTTVSTSEAQITKEDATVELFYDGIWNNHTSDVYVRDQIKITHGKTDAYSSAKPARCTLTFKSPNGEFNPKNPNATLFGKIGRNTPVRVSVGADIRFDGEASSWVPRRAIKGDAWTKVTAHGISHRLGQGGIESLSPMRDYVERLAGDVLAYWALEDGELAASGQAQGSADPTPFKAFDVVGLNSFGTFAPLTTVGKGDLAPWLPSGLALHSDVGAGLSMTQTPGTSGWYVQWLLSASSISSALFLFIDGNGDGSASSEQLDWQIPIEDTGTGFDLELNIDDGTPATYLLSAISTDIDALADRRLHVLRVGVNQINTDELRIRAWLDGTEIHDATFNSEAVTLDGIRRFALVKGNSADDVNIGHVIVNTDATADIDEHVDMAFGRVEDTVFRMLGTARQYDGLDVVFTGDTDEVLHVGQRYTEEMLKVIRDAAAVDQGILHDDIDARRLRYRTGRSLYGQAAALTLDWDAKEIAPPLEPNIDDLDTRNRIVIRRRDGQQYIEKDQDSIDDNGLVSKPHTLNLPGDGTFLENQAGWRLHLGTADDMRFAQVTVDLTASPQLVGAVNAMRPGDRLDLVNLPDDTSVDDVSLLVLGWSDTIGSHRRKVTFNCIPERPYRVAEVGGGATLGTVGSTSATLNEALDTTETGVDIDAGGGHDWDHEGTDYDIVVNGERMTVTAVGAASGTYPNRTQTLTVTRSVNGVVKTHSLGDDVAMADPAYIGL